ncbi:MAG: hypothetical protein RRY21_02445 [Oscillospiraceae bacterium]
MSTAQQIYTTAAALMMGGSGEELLPLFFPVLNLLLAENLSCENGLRASEGLPPLAAAPDVRSLSDEIPYRDALTRVVLPYGAAGLLGVEEDAGAAVGCKNKYEYERAQLVRGVCEPITDVYGGAG